MQPDDMFGGKKIELSKKKKVIILICLAVVVVALVIVSITVEGPKYKELAEAKKNNEKN